MRRNISNSLTIIFEDFNNFFMIVSHQPNSSYITPNVVIYETDHEKIYFPFTYHSTPFNGCSASNYAGCSVNFNPINATLTLGSSSIFGLRAHDPFK